MLFRSLPRRSYEEVCALAGREPRLREGPAMEEEFFPGYRKEPVTYTAGPLRLTLSGAYRRVGDRWEDGPGPVWQVRRGERLTGPGGETGELAVDGGTVRWSWREEDCVLQAEAGGCLITAACQTPAERLDAMESLGKLAIKG